MAINVSSSRPLSGSSLQVADNTQAGQTIDALLGSARERLAAVKDRLLSGSAALDAALLLGHCLGVSREYLIAHGNDVLASPLEQSAASKFWQLLQQRETGAPLAYLLGEKEFWSLTLKVDPRVLIPRPATETLVETVLSQRDTAARRVLDMGTGSGAIALALATERPAWDISASDASADALAVARGNAQALGCDAVAFFVADWYQGLNGAARFDIIVSNPPYIAAHDTTLQASVLANEPAMALLSGSDGLSAIRQIVQGADKHLHRGGLLALEHGYAQAAAVQALLRANHFTGIATVNDLDGHPRVSYGFMPRDSIVQRHE